jgi:hypothetical protein
MKGYRLSKAAVEDFDQFYDYSIDEYSYFPMGTGIKR